MSGLSYLSNGGQGETVTEDVTIQTKPSAGKGRYALPSLTSNLPVGGGVLSSMEQLYADKLAQQQGFMEGMKDAAAWWSGGIEGPSAGLSRRAKEREEQAANLFQIQSQIAQYKAAQEAQKAFQSRRDRELGLSAPPATGARQTAASQMFGMPANIRQALANAKTEAEYDKIFAEWAKKTAEVEASPEFDVPKIPVVTWNDESGSWQRDVVSARQLRANPDRYFTEDGQLAKATEAKATEAKPTEVKPIPAEGNLTEADRAIPAPKVTPAAAISPVAAAAARPVNYTADEITPAQMQVYREKFKTDPRTRDLIRSPLDRPDFPELFNKLPLEERKKLFSALGTDESVQPTQVAAAPAATTTDVTAPSVGMMREQIKVAQAAPAPSKPPKPTASQLEREAEVEKQVKIQAESERLKTDKIERDKFVSESEPTRVTERKIRAERVAKMVREDPTIVGMLTQPTVKSAIANVIQQGLSTPSGAISVKGLSEAIYQTLPSTMSTAKRREIAGYIAQMELDASQAMNGQGQISDGEREIIRAASISIEDPAEVVYKKARMMELRQTMLQKLRGMYGTGDKYTTNFEKFKNEPEYKKVAAEYEAQLRAIANEDVKLDRSQTGKQKSDAPASGKTKSGVPWKVVP